MSGYSNKFVSEKKLEEIREQRKADGQPEEEEYDPRSLYERLQLEKGRKDQEHEDMYAFKNQVHRLDEDEARFLDEMAVKHGAVQSAAESEARDLIHQYKCSVSQQQAAMENPKLVDEKPILKPKSTPLDSSSSSSSQKYLLKGVIKRKASPTQNTKVAEKQKRTDEEKSDETSQTPHVALAGHLPSLLSVNGILPGIGNYYESSESDDSSDIETTVRTLSTIITNQGSHSKE